MIENLEIRRQGEGYLILEQAGSDYHKDRLLFEAADRAGAEAWLTARGATGPDVARSLDETGSVDRVYVEIAGDYAEAEGFPKQGT